MHRLPMPWLVLVLLSSAGVGGGAVWGFVRGLDCLPTLPVAVAEGGVLVGVPAAMLGLLLAGICSVPRLLRQRGD